MGIIEKVLTKVGLIKDYSFLSNSKISFSQSGEDLIVKYIFDALKIDKPSYLDIGAHHPSYLSNTYLFYVNGCRGINIEPDPNLFSRFLEVRKDDINLNIGIGNETGILDFYVMSSGTLNTFSKEEAERMEKETNYRIVDVKKINVLSFQSLMDKYYMGKLPDFITVDVEGLDEAIIKSIPFNIFKPKVICVESISFSENGRGIKDYEIVDYIKSKGYVLYADTNINSIFVLKEIWER